MKTYRVTLSCAARLSATIEIDAENEDDAREEAETEALNLGADDWEIESLDSDDPDVEKVEELTDSEEEVETTE